MRILPLILLLLFFDLSVFAEPNIIGGTEVAANDDIAMMTVAVHTIDDVYGCTGSILDDQTILTAAHCIQANTKIAFTRDVRSAVNSTDIRKVTNVKIIHELGEVALTWEHINDEAQDLAILTFTGGLPAGYHAIKYFTSAEFKMIVKKGTRLEIAGYGRDDDFNRGVLKKTEVTVKKVGPINIWAGDPAHTSFIGDSGGPAFYKFKGEYYQVGVISRASDRKAKYGAPTIFTRFSGL